MPPIPPTPNAAFSVLRAVLGIFRVPFPVRVYVGVGFGVRVRVVKFV